MAYPPRRGDSKGVVDKANHFAAQRFWRTFADNITVEQASTAWLARPAPAAEIR